MHESEDASHGRPDRRGKWQFWAGLALSGIVLFAIWRIYDDASVSGFSDRENFLLDIFLVIFSTLAAYLMSSYFSRRQALAEYESLARPAWRRVVQLSNSVARLTASIERRQQALEESGQPREVVKEWLRSVSELVRELSGQLDDAITDWNELLPEEYENFQALVKLRAEYANRFDELRLEFQTKVEAQGGDLESVKSEFKRDVDKLRAELQKKELAGRYTFALSTKPVDTLTSPFQISPLFGDSLLTHEYKPVKVTQPAVVTTPGPAVITTPVDDSAAGDEP